MFFFCISKMGKGLTAQITTAQKIWLTAKLKKVATA
jgi:hypothetical protein